MSDYIFAWKLPKKDCECCKCPKCKKQTEFPEYGFFEGTLLFIGTMIMLIATAAGVLFLAYSWLSVLFIYLFG